MSNPITISIVDDQSELCEKIAAFLHSMAGFKCLSSYANAKEALARLPGEKPDVILMDINLGGISGIECVRQLKPKLPHSQVIMLTVFEDTEKIFAALTAGASGYLLKRMPLPKLAEAIHEVMDGGSPMSAPIAREVVRLLQKIPKPADANAHLSAREREVLESLAAGRTYKHISNDMGVTINTVRSYIRRIYEKLHVQSRTEAVAKYMGRL
ncbi:MAG: response regulator transcription factor [Verrucomicrobiota bacterium]|jgi:DNA-binding NarL/FixJ family response regulator